MPVGPELPPHLAKRKRSIDDDEGHNSPPHKLQAAEPPRTVGPTLPPTSNPDEVDISDSSEDEYGPSKSATSHAPSTQPAKRILGPAPPPAKNPDELAVDESSSDSDSYGPPKPSSSSSPPPPKRILGPAPPPANLSERPSHAADSSEDSDDDDYGPSLPPPPGSHAAALLEEDQARREHALHLSTTSTAPPKPQREEWMLAPPTDSSWSARVDPTKLKNRKFASGKGAKAPAEKSGISAIWTETPEEKRKRLADEVLGRVDPSSSSSSSGRNKSTTTEESREDIETARRIREYNERNRGKSLYAEKQARKEREGRKEGEEEEDDPSKRGFDREKDMALGGRLGHGEKRELLAKARDFGSRFQKGSYL